MQTRLEDKCVERQKSAGWAVSGRFAARHLVFAEVTKCNNYAKLGTAGVFGRAEAEDKNGKNGAKNPENSAFLQMKREKTAQNRQNA